MGRRKKQSEKFPRKPEEIILNFPKEIGSYEAFIFQRRLSFAYRAVRDVLGVTVLRVFLKGRKKEVVCARRFIAKVLHQDHSFAGTVLIGSAVGRSHSNIVSYRKVDKGDKYIHYYAEKFPLLQKRYDQIKIEEDYDFFDDGRKYSFVEFEILLAKIFGIRIKVKRGRGARRRSSSKRVGALHLGTAGRTGGKKGVIAPVRKRSQ